MRIEMIQYEWIYRDMDMRKVHHLLSEYFLSLASTHG